MAAVKLGSVARECRQNWAGTVEGVPIVGLEHLIPEEITLSSWNSDTDNTFSKKFEKGQVLLGRRRVYLKKAAIAPFDGICSGDITVIEAIPGKIAPELLPFIIQNDKFFDYAMQGSAGSLSPRVKWEHLKDYEFELPDILEQRKLADKLWAAYRLKQSYKKMIEATDEMVKSRFIEMFGNKPSVSIQSIAKEVFAGGDKPSDISNVKTEEYKYPVFSNGIGENALLCYSKSFRVSVPAITVSARGTIGYAEIRNAHFTPVVRLLTLIPKENNNLTFVKYALNQIEYRTSGSSIGQLPVPEFIKLTVPAASITEQDRFSSIAEQADKSKFELKQAIEKIDKVMRSLLQ